MLLIDRELERFAAAGKAIHVGIVGAGFQARGVARQILLRFPSMHLSVIAARRIDSAVQCFREAGFEPSVVGSAADLQRAIELGGHAVVDDPGLLAGSPVLDVVVELTGSIEYAATAVLAAIEAGKHVVSMNAELDGTVGPILKRKADDAGVIYTFSDGDQPGVQMNLFRFVRGIGLDPVLCGNIKGLHDPYRNPDTQAGFAAKWGQNPAMVTSFADGTKISFEQAIVANGTGFRVAKRGMIGPDFSGGDPSAPLVPLEEAAAAFRQYLDESDVGLVDYVVGARPGPGVFVLATTDDLVQRHYLELYKLGTGPYYCFYTPYHLCHFEVPSSIARAVLFHDVVLAPLAGPRVGVIAQAKKDLGADTVIDTLGGFDVYGVAENIEEIRREQLLPIGLAVGTRLKGPVRRDQPLRIDDVVVPPGRVVDQLYAEQERLFGNPPRDRQMLTAV